MGWWLILPLAALISLSESKLQLMLEPPHVLMHKNLHPLPIQVTGMSLTDVDESQTPVLIVMVLESL